MTHTNGVKPYSDAYLPVLLCMGVIKLFEHLSSQIHNLRVELHKYKDSSDTPSSI